MSLWQEEGLSVSAVCFVLSWKNTKAENMEKKKKLAEASGNPLESLVYTDFMERRALERCRQCARAVITAAWCVLYPHKPCWPVKKKKKKQKRVLFQRVSLSLPEEGMWARMCWRRKKGKDIRRKRTSGIYGAYVRSILFPSLALSSNGARAVYGCFSSLGHPAAVQDVFEERAVRRPFGKRARNDDGRICFLLFCVCAFLRACAHDVSSLLASRFFFLSLSLGDCRKRTKEKQWEDRGKLRRRALERLVFLCSPLFLSPCMKKKTHTQKKPTGRQVSQEYLRLCVFKGLGVAIFRIGRWCYFICTCVVYTGIERSRICCLKLYLAFTYLLLSQSKHSIQPYCTCRSGLVSISF